MSRTIRSMIAAVLLAVMMIGCIPAASAAVRFEGKGYGSPEKCVAAALGFLRSGDLDGLVSCYAIESAAKHVDLAEYVKYRGFYDINDPLVFENEDALSQSINRYAILGNLGKQMYYALRNLSGNPVERANFVFSKDTMDTIPDFLDALYDTAVPGKLAAIRTGDFLSEEDLFQRFQVSDRIRDSYAERKDGLKSQNGTFPYTELLGAEDVTAVCLSFTIKDESGYFLGNCVKYGGKWYLSPIPGPASQLALLLGFPSTAGTLLPILAEEDIRTFLG